MPYTPINCKTHPSTPGNGASLVICESDFHIPWRTCVSRLWRTFSYNDCALTKKYDAPVLDFDRPLTVSVTHPVIVNLCVKWPTMTHPILHAVTDQMLPWPYPATPASLICWLMTHPRRTIPGGQGVRLTIDRCITHTCNNPCYLTCDILKSKWNLEKTKKCAT